MTFNIVGFTTAAFGAFSLSVIALFCCADQPGSILESTTHTVSDTSAAEQPPTYSKSAFDISPLSEEQVNTLAETLSDEERRVLLNDGTETAFCGTLVENKLEGTYVCKLCGLPLFVSSSKFDSGTGWPSFDCPVDPAHVAYKKDHSLGMTRTEVECARCHGHLGHVFNDGPTSTNQRYCLNSASLEFFEKGAELPMRSQPIQTETAYFAGGCFWGVEHYFQKQPGVLDVTSGYQGGHVEDPSYQQVCTGRTGHTESVRIIYDPTTVTYRELLDIFFVVHDPRQLNRQGPDTGTQYRSAIFAVDQQQLEIATAFVTEAANDPKFKGRPVVTEINEYATFYEAEDYHQDYNARTGRSCFLPTFRD